MAYNDILSTRKVNGNHRHRPCIYKFSLILICSRLYPSYNEKINSPSNIIVLFSSIIRISCKSKDCLLMISYRVSISFSL